MSSALVTGATSYLGGALAARLVAAGTDTHVVVRPSSDRSRLPTGSALRVHVHDGTTAGLADIVAEVRPEVVFHLATTYRREHQLDDIEALARSNVEFGTQLLESMRSAGVRQLVNTGTYFQHYEGERPLNLYAATKDAFEAILAYYADACGLQAVTVVLYDVYGEGDPRAKLMDAIRRAVETGQRLPLPDGDPVLELVHVDDVVAAFVRAAALLGERPEDVAGGRYAADSGARLRLSEVVDLFEEVAGRPVQRAWGSFPVPPRRIDEPWSGQRLPGWAPAVPLREGIARLLAAGGTAGNLRQPGQPSS